MNAELEAIMRRRRRKADGEPSPSKPRPSEPTTTTSNRRTSAGEGEGTGPPMLPLVLPSSKSPPPPSSVNMSRRSKRFSVRPRPSPEPPPDVKKPAVAPPPPPPPPPPRVATPKGDVSTRQRAIDQIRVSRSTLKVEKQATAMNDSMITQASGTNEPAADDSVTTQDESTMAVQSRSDTMIGQGSEDSTSPERMYSSNKAALLTPTLDRKIDRLWEKIDRAIEGMERSVKSSEELSQKQPATSLTLEQDLGEESLPKVSDASLASERDSNAESLQKPLDAASASELDMSLETQQKRSVSFPSGQDSGVDESPQEDIVPSPSGQDSGVQESSQPSEQKNLDYYSSSDEEEPEADEAEPQYEQKGREYQSSSDEEEPEAEEAEPQYEQKGREYQSSSDDEEPEAEEAEPQYEPPIAEPSFSAAFEGTAFETDFDPFPAFGEHVASVEAEYEPPPLFEAFEPAETIDYSPICHPPKRDKPQVSLRTAQVISGDYQCPPIINPLTGNVIVCRVKEREICIQEIELASQTQVEFTPILTLEVQDKFKSVYGTSAYDIHKVLSMTAGVNRSQGQARVRVAALVDFHTLNQVGKRLSRTALLIYQWGYGSRKSVALQSLLSPPNKTSFTYNHDSLRMADGLVFLSGLAKGKGPCVFCVKPYANNVWSANLVPGSAKVSSIAVNSHPNRTFKYIAIAQTNGSVSVWTYEGAVDPAKSLETPKTLVPFARLESASAIASVMDAIVVGGDGTPTVQDSEHCTHLEWISPSYPSSAMLLLAAAFTNGMALYHVSLPLFVDKDGVGRAIPGPTASAQLSQTTLLAPFCAARWALQTKMARVSWVESGPHTSPCLAFLLERDSAVGVVLGSVDMPPYGDADSSSPFPFNVIARRTVLSSSKDNDSVGILSSRSVKAIVFYKNGSVMTLTPTILARGSYFPWVRSPAASASLGLDSAGYVSLPDTNSDSDGILQVFTVQQCRRELSDLPCPVADTDRLDWTRPKLRHLLCRSFLGDTRDAQEPPREAQNSSNFAGDEGVSGGSYLEMICDLAVAPGLVPYRIVRCKGTKLCAVLYCQNAGHKDGISTDTVCFAFVDIKKKELGKIYNGRDVAFLPDAVPGHERALILSVDGSFIQMWRRSTQSEETNEMSWEEGSPFRSLLGVEADEDFVECRRLALLPSGPMLALLLVGTRVRDERSCLVIGDLAHLDDGDIDDWKCLLPSLKKSAQCWLESKETIESLVDLPCYQDGKRLIAAATGVRVMLLSTTLQIVAEVANALSSPSLSPMGSHTVAYCSHDYKIRYLCSLDGKFSTGLLATLPVPPFGLAEYHLMAVRPERFVYSQCHSVVRLVERGENADTFPLPTATTRPALLLEPMVANALCEASDPRESTSLVRSIIERFGRKVAPFPHGDDEGIGSLASGLTPAVFELLSTHGLKDPASWLLTGSCPFERAANSKVLPPWIPVHSKVDAALNRDACLHIIANGDQYFSDYVKSPDHNMASTLPRPSDPSAVVCHEFARKAMEDCDIAGAMKLLDVAGTSSSDSALLHLALSLQLDQTPDVSKVLKALSGYGDDGSARAASHSSTTSSLAALAIDLKSRQVNGKVPQDGGEIEKTSDEFRRRWMSQLAPSIQRSRKVQRARHRLIGENAISHATRGMDKAFQPDSRWLTPCNESKHIWNEGPFKDKENLLLLDRMEEWLGRKRPAILGKDGAAAALERGEKTLADILNRANHYDDDSFGEEIGGDEVAVGGVSKDGWAGGVGEGRTDEDNLSFYLRMSEGADEDSAWRTDGLVDLTQYANKAVIMGQLDCFTLQPTTSSVDEGESGKVKLLYDLVFEDPKDGEGPVGLLVEAARGSSLDVGMLHGDAHDMRQRCSLEFWYHLPPQEFVTDEIVLVRRSVSAPGVDLAKLCVACEKEGFLWEVALIPSSGKLELRTSGGTSLLSSSELSSEFEPNQSMGDFGDEIQQSEDEGGLVSWERPEGGGGWNHLCLVFSSRKHRSLTDCTVMMYMKGVKVASTVASIVPPGLEGNELTNTVVLDDIMRKTVYLFGLNAVAQYRLTELRLWSCERNEDDIKFMMYESLQAAETKKKFKVKIRNKRGNDTVGDKQAAATFLSPPKDGRVPKGLLPPPRRRIDVDALTVPSEDTNFAFDASFGAISGPTLESNVEDEKYAGSKPDTSPQPEEPQPTQSVSEPRSDAFQSDVERLQNLLSKIPDESYEPEQEFSKPPAIDTVQVHDSTALVFSSPLIRLSSEVRSSAASALIRGPPATRHFGGNRGGLSRSTSAESDLTKRFGVGAIAICGAEKTVVYGHDQTPPGKTYPIGASGAIISDEMDNGEYLCCFLAKDKRMVVFELLTRTVVVELQMTTKLNFWRYLPPQAHGHTLVFFLITPVGGFHWLPLDESPRPRQVWKRGPALQGKKIVTYEEGGSNGFHDADALSAVALLLVSTASTGTPLEAWILQVGGMESQPLCVSSNVLGAALIRPFHIEDEAFLPHLVTATGVESEIVIKVEPLVQNPITGELAIADVSIGAIIDQSQVRSFIFSPPALAMGGWPEVICCCCEGIVVACVRRKGLIVAYDCQEELVLLRQEYVENYIVDGALRPGEGEADVELVLLLSDWEDPRDGFVKSISISRE